MKETTNTNLLKTGIDIGSTTAKIVVADCKGSIIFSEYKRHNTRIYKVLEEILTNALSKLGDFQTYVKITGSAGMGISDNTGLDFIQEVIATTEVVGNKYRSVKTLIDIGGEDSKMIFFYDDKAPDIRMNGSCAGGTGAFIDQTATLLNVSLEEFNKLASNYTKIYPIASRCGVFAKTDIQNLLSRKICKEDIAASVFHAVAIQVLNTLARANDIIPKVMFAGGPFTFMPELINTFIKDLSIKKEDVVLSETPALMPALGAALNEDNQKKSYSVNELIEIINKAGSKSVIKTNRLEPIFKSKEDFSDWKLEKSKNRVKKLALSNYKGKIAFLGIDSGSTTTKVVLVGEESELLFSYYVSNKGKPIESVRAGLEYLKTELKKYGREKNIEIAYTGVTGYGEDLIKASFGIDIGIVETIAHYEAAKYFNKDVSFIMDIGGQDMKAIFIKNGYVDRIELNEACSAGCGSFIETFGNSLGHQVHEFAELACQAKAPCDLGTRCTVFMNSKVKQSLKENASVNDISAGLSISVIKNALYKVLKLKDLSVLGDNVVVQGGTFKNASVLKALEDFTKKKVICSDIPELMGAYGVARVALKEFRKNKKINKSSFIGISNLKGIDDFKTKQITCKGCENLCTVTKFDFSGGRVFYSGNKCEKIFSNKGNIEESGINFINEKYDLLFKRSGKPTKNNKKLKIKSLGIPRVLNIYENFPFWNTLLTECGIEVVLSSPSTMPLYEMGKGTVMSDSICFPAKIVHGHIYDLIDKKVDRIFYPTVIYEENEFEGSENSFNCPIVSSYYEVIRSAINPGENHGIPIDSPVFNLNNKKLLKKACSQYFKKLGVNKSLFNNAYEKALEEHKDFRKKLSERGKEITSNAIKNNRQLVVLAGRPYHTDPLINHKTPEILTSYGIDVISEDLVPTPKTQNITDLQIISQWSYINRIYKAAQWVAEQGKNIQFVQLNSFGCGPDAISIDECVEILKTSGKTHTLIRVDEITSTGSVKLRLRSMTEALKLKDINPNQNKTKRKSTAIFGEKDKRRTILAPYFADIYSDIVPYYFGLAGYNLVILPKPTKSSVQYGLKFSNNEICYPATIIVGDILKYLHEEKYNRDEIAIGITQTGGQCRASTYLSLIKKGMIDAGYEDIPVITVGTAGITINPQPGFEINWKKILIDVFVGILFADSLSKLYYSTVAREKIKGSSKKLLDTYIENVKPLILKQNRKAIYSLLKSAVNEFNEIEIESGFYPKIGLVGEIYIKYNSFGHQYIVDWLIKQGIEVIIPSITDFFTQEFVNIRYNKKAKLYETDISEMYLLIVEQLAKKYIRKANRILKKFRFYSPFHNIRKSAKKASEIINLANQFGEGWLIPAEISFFAENNVNNVVSVQPFGCIANHIISKGVEKKMKEKYPKLNLLFLDFDDGTSEVNVLNRLHFMVRNVKGTVK